MYNYIYLQGVCSFLCCSFRVVQISSGSGSAVGSGKCVGSANCSAVGWAVGLAVGLAMRLLAQQLAWLLDR